MKKGFVLFVALTLLMSVAAFAKVTTAKSGDTVKVTWTYKNADAGSVGLVGDFQGWKLAEAKPMTKGADGVWSITLDFKASDYIKYKFNVDGEWTEDPEAPAGTDDGFGGTNGYVDVAALLGAGGGASGEKPNPFAFGNYSSLRIVTSSAGASGDKVKVDFKIKSYWKLDNLRLFEALSVKHIEIAVDDQTYSLFDGTAASGHETDGKQNFLQWLLSPLNTNAAKTPYLGHFSLVLDAGDSELGYYTHYAKPSIGKTLYFVTYSDQDSLGGLIQLSSKKGGLDLGGAKLDYLVGVGSNVRQAVTSGAILGWNGGVPTGRWAWDVTGPTGDWYFGQKAYYGTKGEVAISTAGQTIGLMLNTSSAVAWGEDIGNYWSMPSFEFGVGAKGKAGDLSYVIQTIIPSYYNFAFDAGYHLMLGADVKYSAGGLSLDVDTHLMGRYISRDAFFQKNDADADKRYPWEDRGLMVTKVNVGFDSGSWSAGLNSTTFMINPLYNVVTDAKGNPDAGTNNGNSTQDGANSLALSHNSTDIAAAPYFNFNLDASTSVGLIGFLDYEMYNKTAPANNVPFEFGGAGLYYKAGAMAGLNSLVASYNLGMGSSHTSTAGNDWMTHSVLVMVGLPDDMGVNLGFVSRGGTVYNGSKVATGLGLGFSKKFTGPKFFGPQYFLNVAYNYDILDTFDEKADMKISNTYYVDYGRNTIGAGTASWWKVATGFKWDF